VRQFAINFSPAADELNKAALAAFSISVAVMDTTYFFPLGAYRRAGTESQLSQ